MTPTESFAAHRDRVIAEVAPDLWGHAAAYAAFIGPRCPVCSHRGCDDSEHLACVRAAVAGTMGIGEMARILGVTGER